MAESTGQTHDWPAMILQQVSSSMTACNERTDKSRQPCLDNCELDNRDRRAMRGRQGCHRTEPNKYVVKLDKVLTIVVFPVQL
jgi:hypothetical protein